MRKAAKIVIVLGISAAAATAVAVQTQRRVRNLDATREHVGASIALAATRAASEVGDPTGPANRIATERDRTRLATLLPQDVVRTNERTPLSSDGDAGMTSTSDRDGVDPESSTGQLVDGADLADTSAALAPTRVENDVLEDVAEPALEPTARRYPSAGDSVMAEEFPGTHDLAPDPTLQHLPTTDEVGELMASLRPMIERCYEQGLVPGQVTLTLTIAGASGRVIGTAVSATTSTSRCVERAAKSLKFPRFAQETATITYPYIFE